MTTDTRTIPLTQGYAAIVDAADYEWLSQWKWRASIDHRTVYALRWSPGPHINRKLVHMHRLILGTADGILVDHANGNGLDNRRSNLRECSRLENNRNRIALPNSTSKYKGVGWDRYKWKAQICVDGRSRHVGYFANEVDAAKAYDTAARDAFGVFARTNFSENQ